MNRPPPTPPGAIVLQAGGRGGTGNFLFLFRDETPPLLLKVYRYRRSRLGEWLKDFSERVLEGKRGATAARRCAIEKMNLDLWAREGFDVVQRVERPAPASIRDPALWIVYYDAMNLSATLAEAGRDLLDKLSLCEKLGTSLSARHTRAVALREPLLIHEHGNVKHFLVVEDRLVAFDLEHAYQPDFPIIEAIARELSGVAQSLARLDATAGEKFLAAFVDGYRDRALLRQAVEHATSGGGVIGKIRRWRGRNARQSKTRVMERMEELLDRL